MAHLSAILAFSMWGLFPLYWKVFTELSAWDLFGHRLLWSFLTLVIILIFKRKLMSLRYAFSDKIVRKNLIFSGIFISSNWLLYIYAVNSGRVLEASMGYFLNPLLNVIMGVFLLKEKLRLTQWPAIISAILAVLILFFSEGIETFPWIAFVLSFTFAFYGLLRKITPIGSLEGLAFETSFILPLYLIFWFSFFPDPIKSFSVLSNSKLIFLMLSGLITCLPLILFAYSARRLSFQQIGFIQYLSPGLKFICGYFILHESMSTSKWIAFIFIWIALLYYTLENLWFMKKSK